MAIVGKIREAQVALRLQRNGAEIMHVGRRVKQVVARVSRDVTDIDVVSKEGGQIFYNQVKSFRALAFGKGSGRWEDFVDQVDLTVELAQKNGGRVRYYVDEISDDVLNYLKDHGVEVIRNANFL